MLLEFCLNRSGIPQLCTTIIFPFFICSFIWPVSPKEETGKKGKFKLPLETQHDSVLLFPLMDKSDLEDRDTP